MKKYKFGEIVDNKDLILIPKWFEKHGFHLEGQDWFVIYNGTGYKWVSPETKEVYSSNWFDFKDVPRRVMFETWIRNYHKPIFRLVVV